MDVKVMDRASLTFNNLVYYKNQLFVINLKGDIPSIEPLTLDNVNDDSVILRIYDKNHLRFGNGDILASNVIAETEEELSPPPDPVRDKPLRTWTRLTYKLDEISDDGDRMIEARPDGSIRVSFANKDDAQSYRDYIREQFYISKTGADALTIGSIYDELKFVNYDKIECSKWGYLSLDHGTCKYISDVSKTAKTGMFGFTLKRPIKLYGTTRENAS